jgi:phage gpG-like protein
MIDFKKEIGKIEDLLRNFPRDVAVLAADLFDQNFETQSFFGDNWPVSEYVKKMRPDGKLLWKTRRLRRSIRYKVSGQIVIFESNVPYAEIHNLGGTINHPGGTAYSYNSKKNETIWISNRKASGKSYPRTKPHEIEMPQRQFIGEHEVLTREIEKLFNEMINKL